MARGPPAGGAPDGAPADGIVASDEAAMRLVARLAADGGAAADDAGGAPADGIVASADEVAMRPVERVPAEGGGAPPAEGITACPGDDAESGRVGRGGGALREVVARAPGGRGEPPLGGGAPLAG